MTDSLEARPTQQCPNCGRWYYMGECRHHSTADFGNGFRSTLYGVCKKCADDHAMVGRWHKTGDPSEIIDRALQAAGPARGRVGE